MRWLKGILNIWPRRRRHRFGDVNFERSDYRPIRSGLQVQAALTFETPCCREWVVLARDFDGGKVTYPIKWTGVACPKCQATWEIELEAAT